MNRIEHELIEPNLFFFEVFGHILGIDGASRGIFEVDDVGKKISLKGFLPIDSDVEKPFLKTLEYKGKLYFIPYDYDRLLIYDINEKSHSEILIGLDREKKTEKMGYFLNACIIQNKIVMIPFGYSDVVIYDIDEGNVQSVSFIQLYEDGGKRLFISYLIVNENILVLPLFAGNIIIELNMENLTYRKIDLDADISCNTIAMNENSVFILEKNKLVIDIFDKDFKISGKIKFQEDIVPFGDEITYFDQSGFEVCDHFLYCFPARWNHAVKVDVSNGNVEILMQLEQFCGDGKESDKYSKFNNGIRVGDKVFVQNFDKKIITIDLKNNEIEEISTQKNDPNNVVFNNFLDSVLKG